MGIRSDPATRWVQASPSDTVDLSPPCRGLWCATAGNAVLVGDDGHEETFAFEAGKVYPLGPRRINSTNTTAVLKVLY